MAECIMEKHETGKNCSSVLLLFLMRHHQFGFLVTFQLLNQLGLEARRLRERYDSRAVNFLLDASLSHKHNEARRRLIDISALWPQYPM